MGYPMFMKPFDGGAWRGVSRIDSDHDLWAAYNQSGEMLMHLQKSVEPYDVFARALTIGPESMVMNFRPDEPMHNRYAVDHGFLSAEDRSEAVTIAQTVNAFFRWEFNSCEMLVQGDEVLPIDYANACPDVAVTSLHYYFPWAMRGLVKWSAFCVATGRRPSRTSTRRRGSRSPTTTSLVRRQARGYQQLWPTTTSRRERYKEFCANEPAGHRRDGVRVGLVAGFRPDADRDRRRDLPRARGGPVPGALPRAARICGRATSDERRAATTE